MPVKGPIVYRNVIAPSGEDVDPVKFVVGLWQNQHMPHVFYDVLGFFTLTNVLNYHEDLNKFEKRVLSDVSVTRMRGSDMITVRADALTLPEFWLQDMPGEFIKDALEMVLETGTLVEGTMRLGFYPSGKKLKLYLAWVDGYYKGEEIPL